MTMYAEVTVIVDGALDQEHTFDDYQVMQEYIDILRDLSMDDGQATEVYIQYHDHGISDDECMCAQYETDHKPAYSWNAEGPGTGF